MYNSLAASQICSFLVKLKCSPWARSLMYCTNSPLSQPLTQGSYTIWKIQPHVSPKADGVLIYNHNRYVVVRLCATAVAADVPGRNHRNQRLFRSHLPQTSIVLLYWFSVPSTSSFGLAYLISSIDIVRARSHIQNRPSALYLSISLDEGHIHWWRIYSNTIVSRIFLTWQPPTLIYCLIMDYMAWAKAALLITKHIHIQLILPKLKANRTPRFSTWTI